jgi:hypothetical protein
VTRWGANKQFNHPFVKQNPQLVEQVMGITLFKVATWNVNSVRVRHTHVKAHLQQEKPDVLLL